MLSDEQIQGFERDGYVVVRDAISAEQAAELRSFFERLFEQEPDYERLGDKRHFRNDIFAQYPETRFILEQNAVVESLRDLLGERFVHLPESGVHDSQFGYMHKDTAQLEKAGLFFHWEPEFRVVQCAIYLQDNTEYGGGLDVIPGSHKDRDRDADVTSRGAKQRPPRLWQKVLHRLGVSAERLGIEGKKKPKSKHEDAVTIPSRAGDLVIFDVRANHMATHPTACSIDEIPDEHRKIALFFVCGRDNAQTAEYVRFMEEHPSYRYLEPGRRDWPEELRRIADERRLTLA